MIKESTTNNLNRCRSLEVDSPAITFKVPATELSVSFHTQHTGYGQNMNTRKNYIFRMSNIIFSWNGVWILKRKDITKAGVIRFEVRILREKIVVHTTKQFHQKLMNLMLDIQL